MSLNQGLSLNLWSLNRGSTVSASKIFRIKLGSKKFDFKYVLPPASVGGKMVSVVVFEIDDHGLIPI